MFRRLRPVALFVLGACALLLIAAGWLASQALQSQAITAAGSPIAVGDLHAARRLISRDVLRKAFHGEPLTLTLTGAQAQALVQDLSKRVLHAPATLALSERQADVAVSLPIEQTPLRALHPLGAWLNVRARLSAPPVGPPVLQAVQVGDLSIPPALALWLGKRAAQAYGVRDLAEMGLSAIETVQMSPTRVSATVRWRADLSAQASARLVPPDMLDALSRYHHQLAALLSQPDTDRPQRPLSEVLASLMATAQQRSLARSLTESPPPLNDEAARENRAVLLVLGLYVNRVSLATLVPKARDWPVLPPRTLTLHGREDWAQHYLTSAAMATDLGGRLSDLVGMYKELLDASPQGQGSGFSFNDLAADKSGVRLGRLAVSDPVTLQARLAAVTSDDDVMPNAADLPEFLTEAQLRDRFGGIDSPAYQAMMQDIDRRISQTPVLR